MAGKTVSDFFTSLASSLLSGNLDLAESLFRSAPLPSSISRASLLLVVSSQIPNELSSSALVSFLVSKGASLEFQGKNGETPFLEAAKSGNSNLLRIFFALGVDQRHRDFRGRGVEFYLGEGVGESPKGIDRHRLSGDPEKGVAAQKGEWGSQKKRNWAELIDVLGEKADWAARDVDGVGVLEDARRNGNWGLLEELKKRKILDKVIFGKKVNEIKEVVNAKDEKQEEALRNFKQEVEELRAKLENTKKVG